MNLKNKILLSLLFLIINAVVYLVTEENSNNVINNELDEDIQTLETHYDILLESQKHISYSLQKSILNNTDLIELLSESYTSTKEEQEISRVKLYSQVIEQYETAKMQGVLQVHFIDKNNISFLRMHKPSKFGDDLTDVRTDFVYTNETKEVTRGFSQGKTTHGFRNVFPIFDKNKKHIGAMEISFSSDRLQWYLNHVSNIHSHFIINKDIFDINAWKRDDLILKYEKSAESKNHMIELNKTHTQKKCIDENTLRLESIKNEIRLNMSEGESFASYVKFNKNIIIVSFLAIPNIEDEVLAWVVAYQPASNIKLILYDTLIMRIVTLLISLLLIYFLVQQILAKQKIEKQHELFDKILNITKDILFITDFKGIKFANDRFKNIFCTRENEKCINCEKNFNVLDLFVVANGFLHKELLAKNEDFISLLQRTEEKNKIVSLLDEYGEPKAFRIHAVKVENDEDYLISLSDITDIKEELVATGKKAYTDNLTKVYNRNKFNEIFEEEILRVQRYQHPLSIAIIDIDRFKDFNDTHGHLIGDEVLITMAQSVNSNVRNTDTFARWGGEEFVILFRETDVQTARTVSLKLKDAIQENIHPIAGKITGSFGLTQYKEGDDMKSIFKRCDDALYLAKENGRNRIEIL